MLDNNNINNKGLKIEPCDTPKLILCVLIILIIVRSQKISFKKQPKPCYHILQQLYHCKFFFHLFSVNQHICNKRIVFEFYGSVVIKLIFSNKIEISETCYNNLLFCLYDSFVYNLLKSIKVYMTKSFIYYHWTVSNLGFIKLYGRPSLLQS